MLIPAQEIHRAYNAAQGKPSAWDSLSPEAQKGYGIIAGDMEHMVKLKLNHEGYSEEDFNACRLHTVYIFLDEPFSVRVKSKVFIFVPARGRLLKVEGAFTRELIGDYTPGN